MSPLARTWLYVPAHHPDRARKALASGADAVVLDLEDAVPADRKEEARAAATAILQDLPAARPQVWVRVNPPASPWGEADIAALADAVADGVRLPRAEEPSDVARLADRLARRRKLAIIRFPGPVRMLSG